MEKEKISLVWRDLLRPLYNLPLHFTHSHHPPTSATAAAESSTALYPVGTEVVTVYGTGKVLGPGEDGVIVVTLDWGARAFLRPDMVLGPNEISEKEKQVACAILVFGINLRRVLALLHLLLREAMRYDLRVDYSTVHSYTTRYCASITLCSPAYLQHMSLL